jgi:hypothetical protein
MPGDAGVSITTGTGLRRMSATELAAAIRSGQVSSREVIEAHLRRIAEVNPAVNAVPAVLAEQALEAALAADRAAAGSGQLSPLHGVPFTVKGNIDLAGHADHPRDQSPRERIPSDGSPGRRADAGRRGDPGQLHQPARLRDRWHTDSELRGATVNPWDRSPTPGASSCGEAAALATGMTPLGSAMTRSARCAGQPSAAGSPHSSRPQPDPARDHHRAPRHAHQPPAAGRQRPDGAAGARPGATRRPRRHRCAAPAGPANPGRRRHRPGRTRYHLYDPASLGQHGSRLLSDHATLALARAVLLALDPVGGMSASPAASGVGGTAPD